MKKLFLLLLLVLTATLSFAQVRSDTTKVFKYDDNTIELRSFFFGNFTDLEAVTNGDGKTRKENQEIYLKENYDIGVFVSPTRQIQAGNLQYFPMGELRAFRQKDDLTIDTVIISTTISNFPLFEEGWYTGHFRPIGAVGLFTLDGTEEVGKRVKDRRCLPEVTTIELSYANGLDTLAVNDTFYIATNVSQLDGCIKQGDTLKSQWQKARPVYVVDTLISIDSLENEVAVYDTTIDYEDWGGIGISNTAVFLEQKDVFGATARNKSWNNWKFRARYFNSNGEVYSDEVMINVAQ